LLLLLRQAQALSGSTWDTLGLRPETSASIAALGDFAAPTPVQAEAVPAIVAGDRDTIVHAQTGSGKTLAYLAPLLDALDPARAATQAVVAVPTRELGLQVAKVARRLCAARSKDLTVMSLLDGSTLRRQRTWAWAEAPHVVVGNAGPLRDMVSKGGLRDVQKVALVVVDEVDLFFGAGREDDRLALHELFTRELPNDRRCVFATASTDSPRVLASQLERLGWSRGPCAYVGVDVAPPATVDHRVARCAEAAQRVAVLRRALKNWAATRSPDAGAVVFLDAKRSAVRRPSRGNVAAPSRCVARETGVRSAKRARSQTTSSKFSGGRVTGPRQAGGRAPRGRPRGRGPGRGGRPRRPRGRPRRVRGGRRRRVISNGSRGARPRRAADGARREL